MIPHWRSAGDPSGEAVLLVNPLGADLAFWDPLLPELPAGLHVVRYDGRGHGRTPTGDDDVDIAELAADAARVLDAAGLDRVHVVGISLGGMVGIELAAARPERVASLAVVCSAAFFPDRSLWDERIATARTRGLEPLVDASLGRWFTPGWGDAHPEGYAEARAMFLRTDPVGYARSAAAVRDLDLRPRLATVEAPTLVVAGDVDPSTPPVEGRRIAEGVPGARFVELPGAHWLPVETPAAVAAALRPALGTRPDGADGGRVRY